MPCIHEYNVCEGCMEGRVSSNVGLIITAMVIYIFANSLSLSLSLSLSREVTIIIILDHLNLLIDQTDHHFTASLTKWTNQLIYVLCCVKFPVS